VASLTLGLYAILKRMPLPRWRDLPGLLLTGIIGIALYNVMLNIGELSVSAGISSFLVNTSSIVTVLLALFLLNERLRIWGWVGIGICLLGVAITTLFMGDDLNLSLGALFVLCAAICQGLYFVWQKPYLKRYSALQCTT
jgi:drug/metabolite transporter (DMT)-like permease